jgi:ParB family chromosome partitioning protein
MSRKRGLGRGLDALIPSEPEKAAEEVGKGPGDEAIAQTPSPLGLVEVPVEFIQPNPHQPRFSMDDESLAELAASISEHGLIQPLIVTRPEPSSEGTRYQLIAGERRWKAAQQAGLERVAVIIKEAAPQEMLELALVENVQRADLNPLEEAQAYRQLIDDFGLTQERVAERVGKSRVAVANTLRLLGASTMVKQALLQGTIREGHARALLMLEKPEAQEAALASILKQGLNVRQTEALVRRLAGEREQRRSPPPVSAHILDLENSFRERLGTKVTLQRNRSGQGQIVIHFYSDEELQSIYDHIVGPFQGEASLDDRL